MSHVDFFNILNFSAEHFPCSVNNGGCDHQCLVVNDYKQRCECNTGYKLMADAKSCAGNVPCYVKVSENIFRGTWFTLAKAGDFIHDQGISIANNLPMRPK